MLRGINLWLLEMLLLPSFAFAFTTAIWPASNTSPRELVLGYTNYIAKDIWAMDSVSSLSNRLAGISGIHPRWNQFYRDERDNVINLKQHIESYCSSFARQDWKTVIETGTMDQCRITTNILSSTLGLPEKFFSYTPYRDLNGMTTNLISPYGTQAKEYGWDNVRAAITSLNNVIVSCSSSYGHKADVSSIRTWYAPTFPTPFLLPQCIPNWAEYILNSEGVVTNFYGYSELPLSNHISSGSAPTNYKGNVYYLTELKGVGGGWYCVGGYCGCRLRITNFNSFGLSNLIGPDDAGYFCTEIRYKNLGSSTYGTNWYFYTTAPAALPFPTQFDNWNIYSWSSGGYGLIELFNATGLNERGGYKFIVIELDGIDD